MILGAAIYLQNPAYALLGALVLRLALDVNPVPASGKISKLSLQTAIVLLGATLGVDRLVTVSADYGLMVALYVLGTLLLGAGLAWLAMVWRRSRAAQTGSDTVGAASSRHEEILLTSGTAICGGTAIATLAPLIGAHSRQFAVATALVFLLNIIAVFTFPLIGQWLGMSQEAFGAWVALAVHDTSSVVATAAVYGDEATVVATTVKLGRTLWLIPLAFIASVVFRQGDAKLRVPGFVLLFVLAAVLSSLVTLPPAIVNALGLVSKTLLVLALAMIGLEINRETLKDLSWHSVLFGVGLWLLVAPLALVMVLYL